MQYFMLHSHVISNLLCAWKPRCEDLQGESKWASIYMGNHFRVSAGISLGKKISFCSNVGKGKVRNGQKFGLTIVLTRC